MLFASDFNDNRVHIDDTHSNQEYYCPLYNKVTPRRGQKWYNRDNIVDRFRPFRRTRYDRFP